MVDVSNFCILYIGTICLLADTKKENQFLSPFNGGGILLSYFSRCFALFLSNNSRVYELSYVFLADHHPASLLYQFFAGCIAYVYLFEKKSMKIVGGYSLMLLAIFLITFEEEYLFTLLFLLLIICFYYRAIQFKLPWVNTVIRTLDEYSFSIYLGHTAVMGFVSRLKDCFGFSSLIQAGLDVVLFAIYIPLLHRIELRKK